MRQPLRGPKLLQGTGALDVQIESESKSKTCRVERLSEILPYSWSAVIWRKRAASYQEQKMAGKKVVFRQRTLKRESDI